jgi:hypothetical protein
MNPNMRSDYTIVGTPHQDSSCISERASFRYHQSEKSDCTSMSQREEQEERPKLEKQKSEPIRFELRRSNSEQELHESERAAEYRDYCMYVRIVSGMAKDSPKTDPSLANVIKTRHSYSNRSDSAVHYSHEEYDYGAEKESTPNLCSGPGNKELDLAFAPRLPFNYSIPLSSNSTTNNTLRHHLPMVPTPEATPGYQSDDDIFDLDF